MNTNALQTRSNHLYDFIFVLWVWVLFFILQTVYIFRNGKLFFLCIWKRSWKLLDISHQAGSRCSAGLFTHSTSNPEQQQTAQHSALTPPGARQIGRLQVMTLKVRQQRSSPISSEVRNRLLRLSYSSHIQNIWHFPLTRSISFFRITFYHIVKSMEQPECLKAEKNNTYGVKLKVSLYLLWKIICLFILNVNDWETWPACVV